MGGTAISRWWHPFDEEPPGRGIQTISFDAPGAGGSGELDRPRRMRWLARMVEHLLDRLGYGRVDVLGISCRGALAQQLAHQAPPGAPPDARGDVRGDARAGRGAGQAERADQAGHAPGGIATLTTLAPSPTSCTGQSIRLRRSPPRGAVGQASVIPGVRAPDLGRARADSGALAPKPRAAWSSCGCSPVPTMPA